MNRVSILILSAVAAVSAFSATSFAGETIFPARSRTLESIAPSDCREWVAPQPERRVDLRLPRDAKVFSGAAQLTITINQDGRYGGLVNALTNDEAFVRAAEDSLQWWTFTAARCNGQTVPAQARVYFTFRQDGLIGYGPNSYIR